MLLEPFGQLFWGFHLSGSSFAIRHLVDGQSEIDMTGDKQCKHG